jgi:prepilin-type N-terminal cleavage/methylation domain-containing protein
MRRPECGFTLLEVLIAMAISTVAITLVTMFAADLSGFGVQLGVRLETEREPEMLMRAILTEIRSMGPAANGSYTIAAATATSITFYTDVDNDEVFEQVRYFLDGTTLKRGLTEPSGTPAQYPAADEQVREVVHYIVPGTAVFTYYPEGHPSVTGALPVPTDISAIRMVQISCTTDKDPVQQPPASTLWIIAMIRNLRGDI